MDWKILTNRLEKAASHAADIVAASSMIAPPIDPLRIAAAEHRLLRVRGDDFRKRFDGQLEYHPDHGKFLLLFNNKYDRGLPDDSHHPRTRFSIAHELGHFYLDEHHAFLRRGGPAHASHSEFTTPVVMEREADAFAAGLLMPAPLMRPLVNEAELTPASLSSIAGIFETSLVSTAIRAVQLSDFPIAVAGIRNGRVVWTFPAECLIEQGCYPAERGAIQSKTAAERWQAFAAGDTSKTTAQAYAREWFRTYDRDRLETLPVTEYHLPVQVMETLVVLLTIPEEELSVESDD